MFPLMDHWWFRKPPTEPAVGIIPYHYLLMLPEGNLLPTLGFAPGAVVQARSFAWEARSAYVSGLSLGQANIPGLVAHQEFMPGLIAGQVTASGE